jgi:hypothetical protein
LIKSSFHQQKEKYKVLKLVKSIMQGIFRVNKIKATIEKFRARDTTSIFDTPSNEHYIATPCMD